MDQADEAMAVEKPTAASEAEDGYIGMMSDEFYLGHLSE